MKAVMLAHLTIKDQDQFAEYVKASAPSLEAAGAKFVLRGKINSVLAGQHPHNIMAVIEFPDIAALTKWYNSKEYQKIVSLRDRAADVTFISYEVA